MTQAKSHGDTAGRGFGSGELAGLIAAMDWSATPLGPVAAWSPALRMMVQMMQANRFPQLLWWGPDYISLYNDAYRPVLGTKHPWALGRPVRECWSEIWHVLQPLIDTPFRGGPSTWNDDITLEINRHGFVEETHFTVAYSPVPDETTESGIGGVLATVTEITGKIVSERRLLALRDLGARASEARTADEACAIAAHSLAAHTLDLPFVLLYLADAGRGQANRAGVAGVVADADIAPASVDLDGDDAAGWPFAAAWRSGNLQHVQGLAARFSGLPQGPWADAPDQAVVVTIPSNRAQEPAGLMVVGLSARLGWDEAYRGFVELLTTQIATAIANACAYEAEKKRAEALAELDRAKTVFFSNVSHELRTPLTLILSPLEDALAQATQPAERERLELLRRNALRLQKLVNSLLDFSRIEAGRVRARYQATDLRRLTDELASVFRSAMEKAGLRLVLRGEDLRGPVHVDRDFYEKIVFNLLSNALKFTLKGEIEVGVRDAADGVQLWVRDTGVGIAAHQQARIFERFARVEGAPGRTHEGSGIGLALVRELVKLHGGSVAVASAPGQGSTFTVTLPRGSAHLPAEQLVPPGSAISTSPQSEHFLREAQLWLPDGVAGGELPLDGPPVPQSRAGEPRPRMIWADDNADMRNYVRRLLAPVAEVEAVADGQAALAAVRRRLPDLVLADVMMPGLDGFGLVQALREREETRTLPVILLSARAGEEARVEGLQAGADDYLVKPFGARELLARVQAHLDMARVRHEASEALQQREAQTAADLHAMRLLHELGLRCARHADDDQACLDAIVATALQISGARTGNLQLLDPASNTLRIAAQAGFKAPFLSFFAEVSADHASACGASLRSGQRTVVEDVGASALFAGHASRQVMLDAGSRAVLSAPLVSGANTVMGAISIHFDQPHAPAEQELRWMDLLSRQAADYLERRRAETALRDSEERFRTLFESMGEGYCVLEVLFDAQGRASDLRFVEGNPAFEAQTGLRDVIGRSTREINLMLEPYWFTVYGEIALNGGTHRFEYPASALGCYYDVCAFRVGAPELHRVGVLFNDITDRKKADEAIRASKEALLDMDRRKDEFLATLAHELRNPLAPLRNSLHILQLSKPSGVVERVVQMMDRQVSHMVRLVDDLMEVSRITRGKIELRRQPCDLAAVARSAVETSRPLIDAGRHQLDVDLPTAPVLVDADPVRLAQVFTNLLNNAAKYTQEGGRIRLRLQREGAEAVVSVSDNGMGIPPEMRARVFDMFAQLDNAHSHAQGGLGIGLTLARSLVGLHGGSVEVASAGPGKGSEFVVRLPLLAAARLLAEAPQPSAAAGVVAQRRVLVVDDNRDAADSLGTLLDCLGVEVKVVHGGLPALEAVKQYRPSLVLLDIGMPDMDGYEVARRIREQPEGRGTTLVALTGWGQEKDRQSSAEAGFDHHLVKPVDFEAIRALLAGPANRQAS